MLEVMRQVVAAAYRALADEGLAPGSAGNVSVAEHGSGVLLVTGSGLAAREATSDGVSEVDLASGAWRGGPQPSSELATHLALARRGHGAIVHAHAPHATAVALVRDRIPCVLAEQALRVGGAAPVISYVEPGSEAMAAAVDAALVPGGVRVAVIRHHGLFAAAPDLVGALAAALAVEEGARAWLLARAVGEPPELPADVLRALAERAGIATS